jgi:hypothetical protein
MTTFKDITYKKEDDETWTEWNNRLDNDEDKLDYIGETIYVKLLKYDSDLHSRINGMMLGWGIQDFIRLLESDEVLDEMIEEAYVVKDVADDETDEGAYIDEENEDEDEVERKFEMYKKKVEANKMKKEVWTLKPVTTLTVAEMIEALSKLPPDAKLVMTESGFYSDVEFAEVMLPEPYIVGTRKTDYKPDMPDGTQVYRIGHSKQWY